MGSNQSRKEDVMQEIWTTKELADSRECLAPRVPAGWQSTELTDEELHECYRLMHQDYEDMGDPYDPRSFK
jgi:hypothetical protein